MSWGKTKTPNLSEMKGKHQYQLPMHKDEKTHVECYYFTPELEARFRDYYPRYTNRQIMQFFGIGFSTVQRLRRELGLEKNMDIIKRKQTEMARRTCVKNGYYDSMKGKAPSPQCMEASRKKRASGWHPLHSMKANSPRKYKAFIERCREHRLQLEAEERRRVDLGLKQKTKLHRPAILFDKKQKSLRYYLKNQFGYILGDMSETSGERFVIYYDEDTIRRPIREQHAIEAGFKILPLPTEDREYLFHFE